MIAIKQSVVHTDRGLWAVVLVMNSTLSRGHWQPMAHCRGSGLGGNLPQRPVICGIAWRNRGFSGWKGEHLGRWHSWLLCISRVVMWRKVVRPALCHARGQDRDQWRCRPIGLSLACFSTFWAPVIWIGNELPVEVVNFIFLKCA